MKQFKKVLESKMKWGIAGCGYFAENSVIPAIKLLRRNRVIAVFSNSLDRARTLSQKFSIKDYSNDFQKFLEGDFNALYVTSANKDHYHQVIQAARAGKHIICEKPLAMNSAQAKEMIQTCKENNVKLSIGYVQRFHPLTIKAKEILENGMIGKLVLVNVSQSMNYAPGENYRFKKGLSGGGTLRDVGTHCIDLLRYFGGEITQIKGFIDNVIYQSEVEDFSIGSIKYKSGGFGNFYASYCISKPINRLEIIGYKGTLIIENLIGRRFDYAKLSIMLEGQTKKAFRRRGNKLIYLLKNFQSAVLKGTPLLVTGEDGLINMQLMEELERSCG
ncbi:MAG: Gfo/Idh/MocA family oxidoreductase [Bacteroidetes bacterium]|nr:Gfo/Idh/MocA family oxidoreductase [Bacteroidota bacterium]